MYDVVYILKKDAPIYELTYSLRSIEENMKFRKVWFYCGKPKGIEPDEYVPLEQRGTTKWAKARSSLRAICENDKITKKFWLFNDDFYVLKPLSGNAVYHRGLIQDHVKQIEKKRNGSGSLYSRQLKLCDDQLHRAGLTTLDYTLHIPLLVDRALMLEALEMFPSCPMFRSLYGNYAGIKGKFRKDVKVAERDEEVDPNADFLSSNNNSFCGKVGEFLKERFPNPCRYEVK